MNYIKRLEQEVAELKQDKAWAQETLTDLGTYLTSAKFYGPQRTDLSGYVNCQDVLDRVASARLALCP